MPSPNSPSLASATDSPIIGGGVFGAGGRGSAAGGGGGGGAAGDGLDSDDSDDEDYDEQDVGEVKSAQIEAHRQMKREANARVVCVQVECKLLIVKRQRNEG